MARRGGPLTCAMPSRRVAMLCLALLPAAAVSPSPSPSPPRRARAAPSPVPGAAPFPAARGAGAAAAFVVANSPRLHNRPLYGPHNGALVLAGDRPIVHLGDDRRILGGLLLGLARGGAALWPDLAAREDA